MSVANVAICIPTFNQSGYLPRAVRSAFAQTYPNVEVWVSDDASTDDTAAVLSGLVCEFPALHAHRQPKNLNIAENTSWLLSQPAATYLVRLDSDDLLEPEFVATLVELLERYPNAGYAHSAVQLIDREDRALSVSRLKRRTGFVSAEQALRDSVIGYRVAANIVMFRGERIRALDFYRNRPDYVEDYDLSIRLADAGSGNVYSEKILSRYRMWDDLQLVRARRKAMHLRGLTRVFDETLEPIFRRRSWDVGPLRRERRAKALSHAETCFGKQFSASEHRELLALLEGLAGGTDRRLRGRLALLNLGFGPVFAAVARARFRARLMAKDVLHALRKTRNLFPNVRGVRGTSSS